MKKTTLALLLSAILSASATAEESQQQPNIVNITINNVGDDSGLEMGTGSRARGIGSIATGKNSVALGKNAVATGGNETKESIAQKLNENKQKLNEIETAQKTVNSLLDEIQTIRIKQAKVIEAGERVKQVRQAKEKARLDWQDKLGIYNTEVANSKAFLDDVNAKMTDLNSRLNGVNRIQGIDISSEEGLTNAAQQLKAIVEDGTTLNLGEDFYKQYVRSYYQALGDLRLNNTIYSQTNTKLGHFNQQYPSGVPSVKNPYYSPWALKNILYGISSNMSFFIEKGVTIKASAFDRDKSITLNQDFVGKDVSTDVATLEEWNTAKELAPQYKTAFDTYFTNTNDPFMTAELKSAFLNKINKKIDAFVKSNEVAYYQGQYEATKNTTWLDKKKTALDEYNQLVKDFNALPEPSDVRLNIINAWKKENITDIMERNKITTDKLTADLEAALNINKQAIQQKEAEIAKLKATADQAERNYNGINSTPEDLLYAAQYDEVMRQLTEKASALQSSQDSLQALRDALTLHDLTNVGENAYALGTNALATGTNSLAIGTDTIATGENAIAMGKGSVVTGTNSIAIGTGHNVLGNNSGAFGDPDYIYGDDSYAFGNNNTIGEATNPHNSGNNTFVLGSNVVTKANNAVIIGANSTDGGDNTVSVGSSTAQRKIVYIANGAISQTSKDAINGSQIYDILQNATDINVASWQAKLGTGTNTAGNTGLITGDTLNTALSNVSAKLKVIAGTNTTVTTGTDGDYQTYAVNVSNDAIKAAIQTDLDSKANANASNITGDNKTKWQAALGDGKAEAGNTGLISGNTLHTALSTKADKTDITNINNTLNSKANTADVDAELAKKANIDASNINTAKFAEKLGTGTVSKNDTNLVSGKTVYLALQNAVLNGVDVANKANKDASNLSDEDKSKWQEALGTGTAEAGNKGLISGDTLNTALSEKANKSEVIQKLGSKADKDASNIDVAKYTEKLTTGRIELGNTGLINGGQVHNYVQNYVADISGRTLAQANAYTDYRIGSLKAYTDKRLKDIRDEARAGVASAMAMGAIPMVPNKRFSIGAGTATYHGQNAVAIGLKVKTENDKAVISLSGSASSNGDFGASAGFAFGF